MKITFFTPADNQPVADQPLVQLPQSKNQYRNYSELEVHFIRDHWESMTTGEIAQALGRSKSGLQTFAWRFLQLKKSPEAKYLAACKGQRNRKDAYTEAERQYLRQNWQIKTIKEMAQALGRTTGSVKSQGQKKMGLQKTHEALSALTRRPNAGQFKKGHLPQTTIYSDEPVIRPRHHRESGITYLYIRLAYGKWQQYHQWLWIQANGPIPDGHIVVFKNGDQTDVRLENLEMITQQENARRNSGSIHLPDSYVAHLLAVRQPELRQELMNHPEILDLKRAEIHLQRTIKEHTPTEESAQE